jgi:vesicle-associated membrane protein 7
MHPVQNELNVVKDIMVKNVEQILSRGERIELLVDKTGNFAHQAVAFRRGARAQRRKQFWKNQKILALSVVVGFLILYLIVASFCGLALHCSK